MQRLPTSQIKLAARPLTARLFHHTARTCRLPRDNQDPTVVSPRTDENTRSGTDDEVAGLSDASYCRDNTKPEDELASAGRESPGQVNPLEVSGANKDVSAHTMDKRAINEDHARVRSRHGTTRGKGDALYQSESWKRIKTKTKGI